MENIMGSRPSACFQFQVEKIVGISADGRYQVQWAPAWVSKFHLVGCEHLIQEFLQEQAKITTEVDPFDSPEAVDTVDDTNYNSESHVHTLPAHEPAVGMREESELQSGNDGCNKQHYMTNCIPQKQSAIDAVKAELDHTDYPLQPESDAGNSAKDFGGAENDPCDETLPETSNVPVQVKEENTAVEESSWSPVNQLHISHSTSSMSNDFSNIASEHDLPLVVSEDELPTYDQVTVPEPSFSRVDNPIGSTITTSKKRHMCSVCGKTCGSPTELIRHMRTHSGEKPFKCTECHKSFSQKVSLQQHLNIHTGAKPYFCPHCSFKSSFPSSLKRHVRTHTRKKPFACSVCGKSFSRNSSLKQHFQIHCDEEEL